MMSTRCWGMEVYLSERSTLPTRAEAFGQRGGAATNRVAGDVRCSGRSRRKASSAPNGSGGHVLSTLYPRGASVESGGGPPKRSEATKVDPVIPDGCHTA